MDRAEQHPREVEHAVAIPFRIVLLVWCIPATVAVLQSAAQFALLGALGREWINVLLQFPRWLAWAFVTPGIVWMARHVPVRRPRALRAVLLHAAAALACIVVVEAAWTQLAMALEPPRDVPPGATRLVALRALVSPLARLAIGVICYTAAVVSVTATHAIHRSRLASVRSAELERDLALARVQAIKMQVHPHFLFNTLHAIGVLITEDPTGARSMVVRLGQLLRTTLSRANRAEVTLGEEVELLRHYLGIEQVRFGDRLTVDYDIAHEAASAYVPDLILQPLAENAIKHGVSRRTGTHRIAIGARRQGDALLLTVEDDGAGLGEAPALLRDGIGLQTVRRRLEHLYGTEQSLSLGERPGGGTCTRVMLPFHGAPLNAEDATAATPSRNAHA